MINYTLLEVGFVCLLVGLYTPLLIVHLLERKLTKEFTAVPASDRLLCSEEPHVWIDTEVLLDSGDLTTTKLCTECGLLSGLDQMVTPEHLARILEENKTKAENKILMEQFLVQETKAIQEAFKDEIVAGVTMRKLLNVYYAGQTSNNRLILFKFEQEKNKQETV